MSLNKGERHVVRTLVGRTAFASEAERDGLIGLLDGTHALDEDADGFPVVVAKDAGNGDGDDDGGAST